MPTPSWKENSVTKYSLGGWTYGGNINNYSGYSANSNFYGKLVGTNNGDSNAAKFEYTPRVSDTIYASWTNQTAQTAYEPKVNVIKSVRWKIQVVITVQLIMMDYKILIQMEKQ